MNARFGVAAAVAALTLIAAAGAAPGATAPVIKKFTPGSGPPGTIVTITGSGFGGATSVKFGSTEALSFSATATSITTAPNIGSSTGPITVATPLGTGTSKTSFVVQPLPPPKVTKLSPSTVPVGTAVSITGSGLVGTTAVNFNGVAAQSFTPTSDTTLRAVVAPGTTSGGVTVTTSSGTAGSPTPITIVPHPVDLADCASRSGTTLTLTGARVFLRRDWSMANASYLPQFLKNQKATLTVNGKAVNNPVGFWDQIGQASPGVGWVTYFGFDTGIVLPTPGASMSVNMRAVASALVSNGFATFAKGRDLWTGPACTITAVPLAEVVGADPLRGPVGAPVWISGSNLDNVTGVKFGDAAAIFTHTDTGALHTRVPAGATTGQITVVEGAAATASSGFTFTVTPSAPLTLRAALPDGGAVGASVRLVGSGLFRVTSVKFGGVPADLPDVTSDTDMTVVVPAGAHTGQVTITDGASTVGKPFTVVIPGGTLDPSFGTAGVRLVDPNPDLDYIDDAAAVVVQTDNKPIVFGRSHLRAQASGAPALVRLNANGSPDATFGTNGIVLGASPATGYFRAAGVALQEDGKILTAGTIGPSGSQFWLARYLSNGSLDATFGTGGIVTSDLYSNYTFGGHCGVQVRGLAVQPDGAIVEAGDACGVIGIVRFLANGSLDATFGHGGQLLTGGTTTHASSLLLQGDGKIVVAGFAPVPAGNDLVVIRVNADGSADTSFATGGKLVVSHEVIKGATSAALDPAGKIVVVGYGGGTAEFVVGRITTEGTVDTTYGSTGFNATSLTPYDGVVLATVLAPPGGPLVLGSNFLARFKNDGTADPKLGQSHIQGVAIDPVALWTGGAMDPQGRLVAVGVAGLADGFNVGRYIVEPTIIP